MKLSIVMPFKNKVAMTEECIRSLVSNTETPFEIILVDDHSTEKWRIPFNCVKRVENIGTGVTDAWNYGAYLAKGDYICWVNNDIVFTKGWEIPLIKYLNNEVWVTSPYHTAGLEVPADFPAGKDRKNNMGGNRTGIPFLGSCFMMERKNWLRVGPIDSRLRMWCGDNYIYESVTLDFGRQCKEIPESYIHHFVSQTIDRSAVADIVKKDMETFDKIYGERRWGDQSTYPWIPEFIDLRLKLKTSNLYRMKVLNIGIGAMDSGLARQLPHLRFKDLEMVDVHKPYIQNAMKMNWLANHIGFELKDARAEYNWSDYDLVMVFDVFEHLEKEESIKIIKEIMWHTNLLIFGPLEKEFRPNDFEVKSQDHLSLWTEQDFKDLGMKTELLPDFHGGWDATWAWNYQLDTDIDI